MQPYAIDDYEELIERTTTEISSPVDQLSVIGVAASGRSPS
jgi:hypothetical protein